MDAIRHVGVIDIGKTNLKVAVVDLENRAEVGVLKKANTVRPGAPYPHYDIDGHWAFICEALAALHKKHTIDALSVTTHGASLVLLEASGGLAAPVLDYEHDGPDEFAADYDAIRPDFSETGSPRLPIGLNAGAQLFWQFRKDPALKERAATILTYPQYWTYRLTGELANEVTSLGCHTDLWNPEKRCFSSLVERLGLTEKMAPVKNAIDRAGTICAEIAHDTGLSPETVVTWGIHDSNASLLPHLLTREAPFSVVSTGTWAIALAIGGKENPLDPARDTLVNVNAFGDPVRSSRFMGGREFDLVMAGRRRTCEQAEADAVLEQNVMLFPSVEARSGPFQGSKAHWSVDDTSLKDGERHAAMSYYLALVTNECLSMIGANGPIIVEGPFSGNPPYLAMLEAASGRPVETASTDDDEAQATGTSIGAALLVTHGKLGDHKRLLSPDGLPKKPANPALKAYVERWQSHVRA